MFGGSHESDFHNVTRYGSKMCHRSVTGVTCDTTRRGLWQTPPTLVIVMPTVHITYTIVVVTNAIFASQYVQPSPTRLLYYSPYTWKVQIFIQFFILFFLAQSCFSSSKSVNILFFFAFLIITTYSTYLKSQPCSTILVLAWFIIYFFIFLFFCSTVVK